MDVRGFYGKYRAFSNFGNGECYFMGYKFPSRENAFQFAKGMLGGEDPASPLMMRFYQYVNLTKKMDGVWLPTYTAKEAKQAGRKVKMSADWDSRKLGIMLEIVTDCVHRNSELKELLLSTEDGHLEEANYWHDVYWGVCYGKMQMGNIERKCRLAPHAPMGDNNLGQILMMVREDCRK